MEDQISTSSDEQTTKNEGINNPSEAEIHEYPENHKVPNKYGESELLIFFY